MSKKSIVFLPYKLHLRHLLFALAEKMPITVFLPPEKSLPAKTKLNGIRIKYLEFGANLIKPFIGSEIRTLKYVKGLSKLLDKLNIYALVTCEFYHWYTLQSIFYKKYKKRDLKLFVISETKRWPRNRVAYLFKRILLSYFKMNFKYIDGMFVYTDSAKKFLERYIPKAKVTLLPVPPDTKLFNVIGEKLFLQKGTLKLLMNARYSPYKRHKDLFSAISNLRKNGKRVQLTCISRYEEDKESIMELAERMGVNDIVEVIDSLPVEKMSELYRFHDVLVLPSYNEAIGMVVPEAMACGLPTVTSDTVGGNVYVEVGKTGFIYETGNIEELTSILGQCFNAELLQRMSESAYKHILNNFTPEIISTRFFDSIL